MFTDENEDRLLHEENDKETGFGLEESLCVMERKQEVGRMRASGDLGNPTPLCLVCTIFDR